MNEFEDEFADELGKVDESLLRDEQEEEEKPVEKAEESPEEKPEEKPEAPKEEAPKEEKPADKPEDEEERSKYIPRGRFDEVNSKYRQTLEELEQLRAAQQEQAKPKEEAPAPVDVIALEREYLTATIDGDDDKAIELRQTINAELIRQAEENASKKFEATMTKREQELATQREQETLQKTAARLIKENPLLDSETGDPELVKEVIEWRDYLHTAKGMSIAEALEQAVQRVAPAKPRQEEAKPDTRRAEEIKNNADASNRQPPPVEGVGNRSMDVKNPLPDDQDEYDKMPEAERKKQLM